MRLQDVSVTLGRLVTLTPVTSPGLPRRARGGASPRAAGSCGGAAARVTTVCRILGAPYVATAYDNCHSETPVRPRLWTLPSPASCVVSGCIDRPQTLDLWSWPAKEHK